MAEAKAKDTLTGPPYEEPRDERFPEHFEQDIKNCYDRQIIKENDKDYLDCPGWPRLSNDIQELADKTDNDLSISIQHAVLPDQDVDSFEEPSTMEETYEHLEARALMSPPFFLVKIYFGEEHRWSEVHDSIIALIQKHCGGLEKFKSSVGCYGTFGCDPWGAYAMD